MHVTVIGVVVVLGGLCAILVWLLSRSWTEQARTGLEGFGALVTFLAVVIGSYWYLDRRPDAPKINLALTGAAIKLGRDALVTLDLTVANVGLSTLDFAAEPMTIYVQKVSPLNSGMRATLYNADGSPRDMIDSNYLWTALRRTSFPYTARIEAGETDHYYFRTVVPCAPSLIVLLQVRLPKKPHGIAAFADLDAVAGRPKNEKWIVESFVDVGETCRKKEKGK